MEGRETLIHFPPTKDSIPTGLEILTGKIFGHKPASLTSRQPLPTVTHGSAQLNAGVRKAPQVPLCCVQLNVNNVAHADVYIYYYSCPPPYLWLSRRASFPFLQEIMPRGDILGLHSISTSPPCRARVWGFNWFWEKSGAMAKREETQLEQCVYRVGGVGWGGAETKLNLLSQRAERDREREWRGRAKGRREGRWSRGES